MVEYYKFDVISNDGIHLIYPVDLSLIYHIKYEWNTSQKGIGGGVVHAVCVCKSESIISGLTVITQTEYDNFDVIIFTADKTTFNVKSDTGPTMTATLPSIKGTVTFKCILPDNSIVLIVKTVNSSRQATCNPSDLSYSEKGKIIVKVFSDTWFTPHLKRPEVIIIAE